jgi:aldose 1-epimerase
VGASAFFAALICACTTSEAMVPVSVTPFGRLPDGRQASLYTLTNPVGGRAEITNYGGILVRLFMPDRQGRFDDVVLGYTRVEDYVKGSPYFGATIGRYANRIAEGKFTLDGQNYQVSRNKTRGAASYHLHGGFVGLDKVLWQAEPVTRNGAVGVKLRYLSHNGDEGYPGNLDITVHYWLLDDNSLRIDYLATTDQATPVNFTNHSYFNLRGEGNGDILDHQISISGNYITKIDSSLIPTGEFLPVLGTPFDFNAMHRIGDRLNTDNEQLTLCGGYDHNWVLEHQIGQVALAADVYEPTTGRTMEIWTDQPGIQFYTGNFLDDSKVGKVGRSYPIHSGFCLETQHFPDSPNHPNFPSTILRPGETFQSSTLYKFGAK